MRRKVYQESLQCSYCGTTFESMRRANWRKLSIIGSRRPCCSRFCQGKLSAPDDEKTKKRFLSFIQTDRECWLWKNPVGTSGYGKFSYRGKGVTAHRASYRMFKGEIPDGMFVCHTCDIKSCVNPDHLFLGTPKDNVLDMWRKGRARPHGKRQGEK